MYLHFAHVEYILSSMSVYDFLAPLALVLAIAVNSVAVFLHRKKNIYRYFGKNAWAAHQVLISIFWGLAVLAGFGLIGSKFQFTPPLLLLILGLIVMCSAVGLFVVAVKQIGAQGLGNGNFFGVATRKLGGVYKYYSNPIYASYVMWYVGLFLATGKWTFIVLAAISLIGLSIESIVEKPE